LLYRLGAVRISTGVLIARGVALGAEVSIGPNSSIEEDVRIGEKAKVGDAVVIRRGASIGPLVAIGNKAIIGGQSILANCTIGDRSFVEYGVVFTGNRENWITVGRDSYIGIYAVLDNSGGIEIGDCVHIAGPTVGVWTHTSIFQCLAGDELEVTTRKVTAPVKIENNVWIGGNSTVYPGVAIGHHTVILPNSVVKEDIASFSLVGGVPARLKKFIELDGKETRFISEHLQKRS
jgi:acetyltransferase-like isoleucine patch superfamily enzyme